MINYERFFKNCILNLEEYIKVNNLKSCIIGISGGIDSTLSACIASYACKHTNIPLIGRYIVSDTNKVDETQSALKVGQAFCTDFKEVNIPGETCVLYDLAKNEGEMSNLQIGNVKARLRMIYLRHLASLHKGIVLDNDNYTEYQVGFFTVAGDSPMDYNVGLHYLYKTEVYEFARYLANYYNDCGKSGLQYVEAITTSMKLTPTDGNGVSNSDCEQFGLDNYEQVDDVLRTMYEPDLKEKFFVDSDKLIMYNKAGIGLISEDTKSYFDSYAKLIHYYNEQGVDKVMSLHHNTEYKRKSLPIMPDKKDLI